MQHLLDKTDPMQDISLLDKGNRVPRIVEARVKKNVKVLTTLIVKCGTTKKYKNKSKNIAKVN